MLLEISLTLVGGVYFRPIYRLTVDRKIGNLPVLPIHNHQDVSASCN